MSEEMNLAEFRRVVGSYWNNILIGVNSKYRGFVADSILKIKKGGKRSDERAIKRLVTTSISVVESVSSVGEDYVPLVFKDLNRIAEVDGWAAVGWAANSADILRLDNGEWYEKVIDSVIKIAGKNGVIAESLARNSSEIIELEDGKFYEEYFNGMFRVNEVSSIAAGTLSFSSEPIFEIDNGKWYDKVIDNMVVLADKSPDVASEVARYSADVLRLDGGEWYDEFIDDVTRVSENSEKAAGRLAGCYTQLFKCGKEWKDRIVDVIVKLGETSRGSAEKLAWRSINLLDQLYFRDDESVNQVFDNVNKLAEESGMAAYGLLRNSPNLLEYGSECYEIVASTLFKLSKISELASDGFAESSVHILKKRDIQDYKEVSKAMLRVGEESEEYVEDLAWRTVRVFDKFKQDEDITSELFLIKSIRNPHDVNVVSSVIGSENPLIEKAYDRVCGEFY